MQWLGSPQAQLMLTSITTVTAFSTDPCTSAPDAFRLLFVGNGDCAIDLGDRVEPLHGDRMLLLRGEVTYRVTHPSDGLLLTQLDFSHIACEEDMPSLQQMAQYYPDYRYFCQNECPAAAFHDHHSLVRFAARSLAQYATYEAPYRNQYLSATLHYLLLVIATAVRDGERQPAQYNRHVRRAIQYMHDHYTGRMAAGDIASHVGIHPGHLHRLFRAETGERLSDYIARLRLEKAKTLLKRTDVPIATVARFSGIATQQYLCRLFQARVGMTPQAYRRSYNVTCDYAHAASQGRYKTFGYGGMPPEEAE